MRKLRPTYRHRERHTYIYYLHRAGMHECIITYNNDLITYARTKCFSRCMIYLQLLLGRHCLGDQDRHALHHVQVVQNHPVNSVNVKEKKSAYI